MGDRGHRGSHPEQSSLSNLGCQLVEDALEWTSSPGEDQLQAVKFHLRSLEVCSHRRRSLHSLVRLSDYQGSS